ncbi:MAG: hypothetical protein AAGF12_13695 [Myxococcota bacterium]
MVFSPVQGVDAQVPVIEPGREAEVVDLFAPFELGGELGGGFRLMNLRIDRSTIEAEAVGPEDEAAVLVLEPRDLGTAPNGQTPSFDYRFQAEGEGARAALERLAAAVRENDRGAFYKISARPDEEADYQYLEAAWLFDGILLCLLAFVFLAVLTVRAMRPLMPLERWLLVAIVLFGGVLRAAVAPRTVLGAWSYSRTTDLQRSIWHSPTLAALNEWLGGEWAEFDVMFNTTLVFAVLTPVAIFVHTRALFRDHRAALIAALIIAILPHHIRFSQSEVAFVPSLVLSSLSFALVHTGLKERGLVRVAALLAVPVALVATFSARPLNILFGALFVAVVWLFPGSSSRRARLGISGLIGGVTLLFFVFDHYGDYGGQVSDGLRPGLLVSAVEAFFSVGGNTAIHPWITPPGLLLAALAGVVVALRGRERRLGLFLIGWWLLFFITHAYVLPDSPAMQARYHLHLVVPLVMLAAIGIRELIVRRPKWSLLLAVYLGLSPLVHLDFITESALNEVQEHRFLSAELPKIPEDCEVLEFAGTQDIDARFHRLGTRLDGGAVTRRFSVQPIDPDDESDRIRPRASALLREPSGCLVFYQGLPCFGRNPAGGIHPACETVLSSAPLDLLAERRFESRFYDKNMALNLPNGAEVHLALYRVRPRRPSD